MADKKKPKKPAGPSPDRLALEGDWKDAMKRAISKGPPDEGWPERSIKKRRRKTPKPG